MNVAITGGGGFVGRHLVAMHLQRGDRVRLLSREPGQERNVDWFQGDLANPISSLESFVDGVDVLYHCAGELLYEKRMHPLHVGGTQRLAETARRRIGRWVQLSSVGAYGPQRTGIVTEMTPERPVGVYETTKAESDRIVVEMAAKGAFEHVILRPSIVYGRDMSNHSLFQLMAMIRRGWFFYIGQNEPMANYVHVSAVVAALMACGCRPEASARTYIVSDSCSLESAVSALAAGMDLEAPSSRLPEYPMRLLAGLFGWLPGFPLTQGRINALTNKVVYCGQRIVDELDFCHPFSLQQGFQDLASHWIKQQ